MNQKPNHTPGPWATNGLTVTAPVFPSALVVCTISTVAPAGNERFDPNQHGEELSANASLITAAPEMYEALYRLCYWNEQTNRVEDWARARAALAKAEGR